MNVIEQVKHIQVGDILDTGAIMRQVIKVDKENIYVKGIHWRRFSLLFVLGKSINLIKTGQ